MDEIYKRMNDDAEIEESIEGPSRIQEFFAGHTVFLTGATGFMGKMFVEKLLRSCPDVKKLYLLIRTKKQSPSERMKAYFDNPLFDVLKRQRPNYQSVVSLVEGDLLKENMALSAEDRTTLVKETTLMYHIASNVKFNERMSVAIKINVFGTRDVLDLAKECKRLVLFFYVSTAYSHCYNQHLKEEFLPPPTVDMKMLKDIMVADAATSEGLDEEKLKKIRGKWLNNYCFTKSMAEYLVEQCATHVPFTCGVYRPSIVMPTYLEPIRAWSGNINGSTGLAIGTGTGFLHAIHQGSVPIDLIPADMANNALFAATWDAVENNKQSQKQAILYNYGSTMVNPINIKDLGIEAFKRGQSAPSINTMGKYWLIYVNTRWQYWLVHCTFHLLTAVLVDFLLICSSQKPKMMALWKLMAKSLDDICRFSSGNWFVHVPRMKALWGQMNKRDAQLFFCDLHELDWIDYSYAYWIGLRVYLINEPMDNMMVARKRYEKVKLINGIVLYGGIALIIYFVCRFFFSIFGISFL